MSTTVQSAEVVVFRGEGGSEEWRVFVVISGERHITTPVFNSKGAARAYADGLASGYRRPELHTDDGGSKP